MACPTPPLKKSKETRGNDITQPWSSFGENFLLRVLELLECMKCIGLSIIIYIKEQQHTSEPDLSSVRHVILYYCCSHRLAHVRSFYLYYNIILCHQLCVH